MSIELGKLNTLSVVKEVEFGMYLDGGEEGEILLPTRYIPEGCQVGDKLQVFLYLDQDERLIATTLTPYVQVGQFAYLEVAWVNQYGAFLKWGLMKDLFCPFREQKEKMEVGKRYMVHAHLDDESYRIVASAKVWLSASRWCAWRGLLPRRQVFFRRSWTRPRLCVPASQRGWKIAEAWGPQRMPPSSLLCDSSSNNTEQAAFKI